ncbi:sulfite exporter TauE/SafE family protein [Leucothrix sargassi]|nr:sulfite exporter TauE/SafE family protein [Leucothrix sargassi]
MGFVSALLLGLLASLHCAGMCGGLQAALNRPQALRKPIENQLHLLSMNLGRVALYTLAGTLIGFVGQSFGSVLDFPDWSSWLRRVAAIMIIVIGFQLLFGIDKPFAYLEKYGYKLWQKVKPYLNTAAPVNYMQSFKQGLVWGFLPCGLVYSVLSIASLSGSAWNGAQTMLGFGIGTLPAMLLTGQLFWGFKRVLQKGIVQKSGGIFFIIIGTLIFLAPQLASHEGLQKHPVFHTLANCFL